MTVLAAKQWKNNSDLMADVAKLGYLGNDGSHVIDVTYGRGNFWGSYRPARLLKCDNRPLPNVDRVCDFRSLPFEDGEADVVVMDPPYRLNGTPDQGDFDDRFGIHETMRWQDKMRMIEDGIVECARVLRPRGGFLLKCQDQVCSGAVRWQTIAFPVAAARGGLVLIDRFDMIPNSLRAQPPGRTQRHAYGRPSTLLVFEKRGRR